MIRPRPIGNHPTEPSDPLPYLTTVAARPPRSDAPGVESQSVHTVAGVEKGDTEVEMRQVRQLNETEEKRIRLGAMTRVWVSALMAALGVIGFLLGAGSFALSATRTDATVNLRKTKLGPVLVNSKGHTLYLFKKDKNGKSSCTGSCATSWPPLLTRGKPTAGSGVKASLLGTTRRSNGSLQVTYNKHPLYRYTLDTKAGQTKGEGVLAFGAKWYAVSAKGTAVVRATTTTPTTTSCPYPPC
jgi:predicted lipoprotein with Yx(FWY)xxD motif